MDKFAENLVVSIRGKKEDEPVGGGVIVGNNLIATCSHVVNQALDRELDYPNQPDAATRVWIHAPYLDDDWSASVCYWRPYVKNGTGCDDLALLVLEEAASVVEQAPDFILEPQECDVRVWGFHSRGLQGAPINARFLEVAPDGRCNLQGVDAGDASFIEGGASGCGIFKKNTHALLGIVASRTVLDEGREGLGIGSALIQQAFEEITDGQVVKANHEGSDWRTHKADQEALKQWRSGYKAKLSEVLQRLEPSAWERIATELNLHLASPADQRKCDEVLKILLSSDFNELQRVLCKVHLSLKKTGSDKAAATVQHLLFLLGPVHTDENSSKFISWRRATDGGFSLVPVAATPMKAERLAAGIDGQEENYNDRKVPAEIPSGVFRIPYPPTGGIDPNGEAYLDAICNFLLSKLDPSTFVDDIVGPVHDKVAGGSRMSLKALNDFLRDNREIAGERSFYLTVPSDVMLDDYQRARLIKALNLLASEVPEILVIAVSVEGWEEEAKAMRPLALTVPLAGEET